MFMDDFHQLQQRLEILEIENEALKIRLDAFSMLDPSRHMELLERYYKEYQLSGSSRNEEEDKAELLRHELEDRIRRSKERRVYFVIQKPVDEFGFRKRTYRRRGEKVENEVQEQPRELTFEEQIENGPMGSGKKDARIIARTFLDNDQVNVEGLITATQESRTVVNYYLRLFKSQGYIQYLPEQKFYTPSPGGIEFFKDFIAD
jgi:hypothetical protein